MDGLEIRARRVSVPGGGVATYSLGRGDEVLLLLHGGPGMGCGYLRDAHVTLAGDGLRVVTWDQLGGGASDRPEDESLWTLARYVEEVEAVRRALGLGRVHLLGQSWGALLAIEYALAHPEALRSLILLNGTASMPQLARETDWLRERTLGPAGAAMMRRHEAAGTFDDPKYLDAMATLNARHLCRLPVFSKSAEPPRKRLNGQVYETLVGPNDYCCTGRLKDWDRLGQLGGIDVPALVLCGAHDMLTPACSRAMHEGLRDSRLVVLPESSHLPFWEEPEAYLGALRAFLGEVRGAIPVPGRSRRSGSQA